MELIKGDGGAPAPGQIPVDVDVKSRIVSAAPGLVRIVAVATLKLRTEGEGHRRIAAQAEIEVYEGGIDLAVGVLAEWQKQVVDGIRKMREQYEKMIEDAKRRVVPASGVALTPGAMEQIKRGG